MTTLMTAIVALASVPLLATPACTLFVDHSTAQCRTDDDCGDFGFHPYCQHISGTPGSPNTQCQGEANCVCVPSKLQPKNCFFGPPSSTDTDPKHFLNQCSTGALFGGAATSVLGECLGYNGPTNPDAGLVDPDGGLVLPQSDGGVPAPRVLCKDVAPGGSVLYMSGSSNFPPLLEKLAPAISKSLAAQSLAPITPVFRTTTSCAGVQSVYPVQPTTTPLTYYPARTIRDPVTPTDTYAQYFDTTTGRLADCSLGSTGAIVDIGESEIFAETCANPTMPSTNMIRNGTDVAETPGPILAIEFVAPAVTDQRVISAAAAREVFGAGGLAPWTIPLRFYIRGGGTATAQLIGHAIGVPSNKLWGVDQGTAKALDLNLRFILDPDQARTAIGILGADYYDQDRAGLKALGFQATDQDCAYTPDTNSNSVSAPRDKINVRDGHYPIWGPIHFFSAEASSQAPSQAIANFVMLFGGTAIPQDMLDAIIDASFVPKCAMMVKRDSELGPLASAVPVVSCGCHFDARVNSTPTVVFTPPGCKICKDSTECPDPKRPECIYGFCEFPSKAQ